VSKRKKEEKERSERFQMQRMVKRYELLQWSVPPLIWIASLWIPLQAVLPIAHELAGKNTALTFSFTFSVVVSIAATGAMLGLIFKYRGRKGEIQRLREIIEEFEKDEKGAVTQ
jgi:uncharacterized membrane protein (DUF106 family)